MPSGTGIASINADTTWAQVISGGTGISVSTVTGTTTVSTSAVTGMTAFGGSSSATGATIASNNLTITPADITNPGSVSTAYQAFTGAKEFALGAFDTISAGSDADTILTTSSSRVISVPATAARTYTLPSTGLKSGETFTIANTAAVTTSNIAVNIVAADASAVVTVYPGCSVTVLATAAAPATNGSWTVLQNSVASYTDYTPTIRAGFDPPMTISITAQDIEESEGRFIGISSLASRTRISQVGARSIFCFRYKLIIVTPISVAFINAMLMGSTRLFADGGLQLETTAPNLLINRSSSGVLGPFVALTNT